MEADGGGRPDACADVRNEIVEVVRHVLLHVLKVSARR
jgi:hypothetical protein